MSSKQWHGGKGDAPRVGNDEAYQSNWDRIFGGIDYTTVDNGQGTVETVATTMDTMDKDEVGKVVKVHESVRQPLNYPQTSVGKE